MGIDIQKVEENFTFSDSAKKTAFIILGIGLLLFVGGYFFASSGDAAHGSDGHALNIATDQIASVSGGSGDGTAGGEHGGYSKIKRVWSNLWINNMFFTGIALCGIFFLAIQYVTVSGWSVGVQRVMLALGYFLPIGAGLIFIVYLLGHHDLFHWTHEGIMVEGHANYDKIIAGKKSFLNPTFYYVRMAIFLGGWILFMLMFRKFNKAEDIDGGTKNHRKMVRLGAGFLVFFGVSTSIASWDWLLSIDTHWFSTMYGWYVFASWFVSGLAAITLITILLKEAGYLKLVNENHLHDLGKFVFGFSVFWTYIWFSQFLLIYYANIPEETVYFLERLESDYYSKFIAINLIFNFFFPFLAFMTRDAKRKMAIMKIVCIVVLVGHWLDFYLMVTPAVLREHGDFWAMEVGSAMLYLGVFILVIGTALTKLPLVAKNHPMLEESLHHHI